LKEYRTNKRANEIFGNDRKQECKWFLEMNQWHGSMASVQNQIPASAAKYLLDNVIPSTPTLSTQTTTTSAPFTQDKKEEKSRHTRKFAKTSCRKFRSTSCIIPRLHKYSH
jgi:hypothetical protein